MPPRYTNREIMEKLDALHIDVKLTNGRVRNLERWRAGITGGLAVLTTLTVPVLISLVISWIK